MKKNNNNVTDKQVDIFLQELPRLTKEQILEKHKQVQDVTLEDISDEFKHLDTNHKILNLSELLLNSFFKLFWIIDARYKFVGGSKDNGKSKGGALYTTTKFLAHNKRNCVAMRKFIEQNKGSTFRDIKWCFKKLSDSFEIPQLKTVNAKDVKKHDTTSRFIAYESDLKILDRLTGTAIYFTGLDRLAQGGFSTDDPTHAIDTVWYEEPVDLNNLGTVDLTSDDLTFAKFQITESTVLRGFWEVDEKTGEQKMLPGFEWVKPEVIFTFNAHNPDHWVIKDFFDKYVPFNVADNDEIKKMEKKKFNTYYDRDFQGGDGLFVARTTNLIHPLRDKNLIERRKSEDIRNYAYVYLGGTRPIGGYAYSAQSSQIIKDKVDISNIWPISAGVDHAFSPDHGDWFSVVFHGTSWGSFSINGQVIPRPTFKTKIFFSEYGWNNKKFKQIKGDEELASDTIKHLINLANEAGDGFKNKIVNTGFIFSVDNSATGFIQQLTSQLEIYKQVYPEEHYLHYITVLPVKGKNETVIIDGRKEKARKARVINNRKYMEAGMYWIDQTRCPYFLNQTLSTSLDLKGEVIDKNRDFVDAGDYSWMPTSIRHEYEKQYLTHKQIIRARSEMY